MAGDPDKPAGMEDSPPRTAVLGIGAVERHGSHLPIGCDWILACELSQRVAEELNAVLLPAIPFSMSECHGSFGGTVWLKPATLAAVVRDIACSLHRQKIDQLLILNCHGGNFILDPTIQQLGWTNPEIRILLADEDWPLVSEGKPIFECPETDLHAGEMETSLMLFLNPELVRDERVDFVPPCGREFLDYVKMDRISPTGVWGSPSKGSAEKGARAMAEKVKAIVAFARMEFGRARC
jgi:creatinine amidohydrolase